MQAVYYKRERFIRDNFGAAESDKHSSLFRRSYIFEDPTIIHAFFSIFNLLIKKIYKITFFE